MILLFNKKFKKKLSAHFSSNEFECPCCGYALIDESLVHLCEKVRAIVGKPITINSGYRCPRHNVQKNGAEYSRHLMGCAADLDWDGAENDLKSETFKDKIRDLAKWHGLKGVGWGGGFVHVDTDLSRIIGASQTAVEWVY